MNLRALLGHDLAYSFRRSPVAIAAAVLTLVCVGGALLAPWLAPHNPFDAASLDLNNAFAPPAWVAQGVASYPLGTDDQGRDVLSTIMYGARISLGVGVGGGAVRAGARRQRSACCRAISAAGSMPSSCASPTSSFRSRRS